jgi:hypothetical protein
MQYVGYTLTVLICFYSILSKDVQIENRNYVSRKVT